MAEFNDANFAYTKVVNDSGIAALIFPSSHNAIQYLTDKAQIEIWRKTDNIDWYIDFKTIVRDEERSFIDKDLIKIIGYGANSGLSWRIINWPADYGNRSIFTNIPAETVMKTLADYNVGPNALTSLGRKRDGSISGLTIRPDLGQGNLINWSCFGGNLLDELQKIALIGGGDFALEWTEDELYFQYYPGQYGTDRSDTIKFNLLFGNMAEPVYKLDRGNEKTVACIWGKNNEVVGGSYLYLASSDIPGYRQLLDEIPTITETTVVKGCTAGGGQTLIDEWISYPVTGLGYTLLEGGTWQFTTFASVSEDLGETTITTKVYKRTAIGDETQLFEFTTPAIHNTEVQTIIENNIQADFEILATDRIVVKHYCQTTYDFNIVVTLYVQGTDHASKINLPSTTENAIRDYQTVLGENYSIYNDIEVFVNASNTEGTAEAYTDYGNRILLDYKAADSLAFKVIQTDACMYGRDYFLGDLVTGIYNDVEKVMKIKSVSISFEEGKEIINIELDNRYGQ